MAESGSSAAGGHMPTVTTAVANNKLCAFF
jgi:hypothetical protein